MNAKQFFDWQTSGGVDDVTRFVECLERASVPWCAHRRCCGEPLGREPHGHPGRRLRGGVGRDRAKPWPCWRRRGSAPRGSSGPSTSRARSTVSIQLTTEEFYPDFPSRSVPADVYGILLRVASLEDTLRGKMKAWSEPTRRQSKRIKDLADIARLVETHPPAVGCAHRHPPEPDPTAGRDVARA